jgi:SNF2 family DNA or RNA helicase
VLADDMGLGKTVQVLAHVAALKHEGRLDGPVLVLCPTSVVDNWRAETERFAPMLRVRVLSGSERHEHFDALAESDLVITSYALLWRDIEQLKAQRFALAVFDEAQWLKNASSRSHGAASQLDAARRLCLTGTPVENHLGELKAQFDLAFPGLLGSHEQFRTRFRQPIERDRDADAAERLRKRIAPVPAATAQVGSGQGPAIAHADRAAGGTRRRAARSVRNRARADGSARARGARRAGLRRRRRSPSSTPC